MKHVILILTTIIFLACDSNTAETNVPPMTNAERQAGGMEDAARKEGTPVANRDNTSIYKVDPDDRLKITNGSFMGLRPGLPLEGHTDFLEEGMVQTQEGEQHVMRIIGDDGNLYGYVQFAGEREDRMGEITVNKRGVVTEQGIVIGVTVAELEQRLGELDWRPAPVNNRLIAEHEGLTYQVVGTGKVSPEAELVAIVIK